jgi:curli production assembly/transport component CsgF
MKNLTFIFYILFSNACLAQDFVYKPRNPNFGGDSFNYQWLLNSADSQNLYKDPDENLFNRESELDTFTKNLNNQLLNQITRSLFQDQFGTGGGLNTGTYTFGSLSVEIFQSNLGLVLNILDILTGEESQIIIPGR